MARLEKEPPFPNHHFLVFMLVFGCVYMYIYIIICIIIYIYVYKNILLCREILYATLQRCNMILPFFRRYCRLQGLGLGWDGPGSCSKNATFCRCVIWIGKYPGNIKESLRIDFRSLEFRFGAFLMLSSI